MSYKPVFIKGIGVISSLGRGAEDTWNFLRKNASAIKPLQLFDLLQGPRLPVGEIRDLEGQPSLPRTHRLAQIAAEQALNGCTAPPDAVVVGTTTGGILTTEQLLRNNEKDQSRYRYHGLHTVADHIARQCSCTGPALTFSTACSSGVVAISIGLRLLRSGKVKTVLAGGVDSLCRLTYFGFHSLQLVDADGSKPLDRDRKGMAVAEGAGMLLLTTEQTENPVAQLLGAGLSCDGYHPAAPHPEGQGAYLAMQAALADAGLSPQDISYINLHGTGTPDNDLAESKALRRLFANLPPLSSIKGASGHSLAAAGAIEAVVSTISVSRDIMPANTGLREVDPELGLSPLTEPLARTSQVVLTNSFGFGGNNGSLVIGKPEISARKYSSPQFAELAVHGYSCLSGAGNSGATIKGLTDGQSVAGIAGLDMVSQNLPPRLVRRLKKLPRMALSLAVDALEDSGESDGKPHGVFMGTGWGALSETFDFLSRLNESGEQFPSPTDFVGSVHNAPASQVAIMYGANGPNVTASGGDYSFEQALLAAELMHDDLENAAFVMGADEGHPEFSPLLDPSVATGSALADGGAAFYVSKIRQGAKCCITVPFYRSGEEKEVMASLVEALTNANCGRRNCTLVLAGIPLADRQQGEKQLEQFLKSTGPSVAVVDYRKFIGEFASASAVAAAWAVALLEQGVVPESLTGVGDRMLDYSKDSIVVLGLGRWVTAMEIYRP